jgi:hypothetical protein
MKPPENSKVRAMWFALLILGSFHLSAETFWDGLVSYNPPLPMSSGTESGNEGTPATGFEFSSEGTTNGYAQVTFQISSIVVLFNHGMPKEEVKTISDLKKAIDTELQSDFSATNYSTAVIKFDDRDAVCTTHPISGDGPAKLCYGVTFFWHQSSTWLRSSIFSVYVAAEKRETFDKLVASLKTVKIQSPSLKLAKDGMQLGFTQDETRKLCGEPSISGGPVEIYITDKYVIETRFDATSKDKLALITYAKVRDPQQAADATSNKELIAQTFPLTQAEAQGILQRQTSGGKLIWSSDSDNHWKRSDGAMAALVGGNLAIATAEMWPKLNFQK